MEEVLKTEIQITDEGVIYIDNLLADYKSFDDSIMQYSVNVIFYSKQGYEHFVAGYKNYLSKINSVKEIHRKIDFIEYLYKMKAKFAEDAISSSLAVIKYASRVLGISETEIYKHNIEQLNKEAK